MAKTVNGTNHDQVVDVEIDDKIIIDDNADGFKYIGSASRGKSESGAYWVIIRISSGNPKVILHAPQDATWDDRLTEVYS